MTACASSGFFAWSKSMKWPHSSMDSLRAARLLRFLMVRVSLYNASISTGLTGSVTRRSDRYRSVRLPKMW